MCVAMVVGDGVADFIIAAADAVVVVVIVVFVVAFVVTSDLHTAVDSSSVEFDFAVDAFCGTIFSPIDNGTEFTCNGNNG